jgi:hypothetical protein
MATCPYCDSETPPGAALCPACGASLRPDRPARFGSPAADGWIGGLLAFFLPLGSIIGGLALSEKTPWLVAVGFLLPLIIGIVTLALIWKKYPTLQLGVIIGLCLALLNPFSLCVGVIGVTTMAGN